MKRVKYLVFPIFILLLLGTSAITMAAVTTDDLLYQPSQDFLDDFFLSMSDGNCVYPGNDGALVLRRLYSMSESVGGQDYVSAWQTLINIPDNPGYPAISDVRVQALAVQSVIPWFSDRELRENFLKVYDEIWLKNDGIEDNYKTFKEIYSGYASQKDKSVPAVYLREHLGYYGYSKSPGQPPEDMEFIWNLLRDFSVYAASAAKSGIDYRTTDTGEYSKLLLDRTSQKIKSSWSDAITKEQVRTGVEITPLEPTNTIPEIVDEAEKTTSSEPEKIDYSKFNVFQLPEGVETVRESKQTQTIDETPKETESSFNLEDETPDVKVTNPMVNGKGIEPPEKIAQIDESTVVRIPKVNKEQPVEEIPIVIEDLPESAGEKPFEVIDKKTSEQPVESTEIIPEPEVEKMTDEKTTEEVPVDTVFVSPSVKVVEESKETEKVDETQSKVIEIPKATPSLEPAKEKPKEKPAKKLTAKEKKAQEKLAKEKAAKEKALKEKQAKEKAAKEKAEKAKAAKEKAEKEKQAKKKTSEVKAADKKPIEIKPTEKKTTDVKAVEEKPAEVIPTEEKPVEEGKPAEESNVFKEESSTPTESVNLLQTVKPTEKKTEPAEEKAAPVEEKVAPEEEKIASVEEKTEKVEETPVTTEEKVEQPSEKTESVVEKTEPPVEKVEPSLEATEEVKVEPMKPAEEIPVIPGTAPQTETQKIAQELTDKTYAVAEELGKLAIDLVLLWSQDPEQVKDYAAQETKMEGAFKVRKEEFLALLFINDAFRLEDDLGMSFDALNGRIMDSLLKGFKDFKESGGLKEYPDVDEAKLLAALSQLTQGVEDRRDSLKIQNASLKAFRLRRSQFEAQLKKLEQLKKIEIPK